jgi:hypothetical protein
MLFGIGTNARADQIEGLYLGAGLAYTRVNDVVYDLIGAPVVAHPAEFDSDHGLGLKAGWGFGSSRLELEWIDLGVKADTFGRVGEISPAIGKLDVNAWMVNVFYDFDLESRFIPYLGVGIGQADVKAKHISKHTSPPDRTGFIDGGDKVFSWQAILGVAYQWNEHLGVSLDYRWMKTGDVDHDYGVGCIPDSLSGCIFNSRLKMDYDFQALSLGLRWVF